MDPLQKNTLTSQVADLLDTPPTDCENGVLLLTVTHVAICYMKYNKLLLCSGVVSGTVSDPDLVLSHISSLTPGLGCCPKFSQQLI